MLRANSSTSHSQQISSDTASIASSVSKMPNPKYYAATKERLLNPKVYNLVRSTTCKTLKRLFAANPKLQFSILRHLDDLAWANQQLNEMNPGRNQP